MRLHTSNFKEQIKTLGRVIDSKITCNGEEIDAENLFSISPVVNTDLLKSVMKELDFEANIELNINDVINYKFGMYVNDALEWIDYGNYIIYDKQFNEDTKTYNYVCYDKMLNSMIDYEELHHGEFPMSVRDFINNICLDLNINFANANSEFANYNRIIPVDRYKGIDYTYRDILDDLAQVTASNLVINNNDELEIRYINDTNDTIDEEYLKDVNVKFSEKYGPINSIVLSRSAESDNVYLKDDESIEENGLTELKISNNQIMNFEDRADYLQDILNRLDGLEYYINDFDSTGILYYEVCDMYNVQITDENDNVTRTYKCLLLNDEQKITQGIEEKIYTEMPEISKTDYNKASKDDRQKNRTSLIVDKVNGQIEAVVSKVEALEESIDVIKVDLDNNIALISVDNNNVPFSSKQYTFNYSVKYLGEEIILKPTTESSFTGITYTINNNNIVFDTSNAVAIPNEDNKFVFTWTYNDGTSEFTTQKVIMLSTLKSEVEQNVIMSETEPENHNVLWYDTTSNIIKNYDEEKQEWVATNDSSSEIQDIQNLISGEDGLANKLNELTTRLETAENDINNKVNSNELTSIVETTTNELISTNTYTKLQIQDIVSGTGTDGVVVTAIKASRSATFDINGLNYEKDGANTKSLINEQGMSVSDTSGNEMFFAGVREGQSSSIVETTDLTAKGYTIVGKHGRFEEYENGVGFFLI